MPAVEAAPFDIAPRILFYLSFPLAIALSIVCIFAEHVIGQMKEAAVVEKELGYSTSS